MAGHAEQDQEVRRQFRVLSVTRTDWLSVPAAGLSPDTLGRRPAAMPSAARAPPAIHGQGRPGGDDDRRQGGAGLAGWSDTQTDRPGLARDPAARPVPVTDRQGEAMPPQRRGLGKGLGALIPTGPAAP